MDAVLLALASAALFGGMTVALQPALARETDASLGALATVLPATAVACAAALLRFDWDAEGVWAFALAGLLGPGLSQVLFTLGVRDAGPARASVTVGTAPLFSVAIALVFLGEPAVAGVLAGAVLVVAGGVLLASERDRPAHVKRLGLAFALGSTLVFASRDNLVRWLSVGSEVSPELAAAATLATGTAVIAAWTALAGGRLSGRPLRLFAPAGLLFGLSYVCLFEAYYRGRVTVVSPLVATESLFGVLFSAVFLHRTELVGRRLVAGAALIVAGGVLIGLTR
ncbi:MAG TPA: DMT family transporter [Gaiellaceae bacterium]|nr:DMT family transporter [Gaiellaceae bacterium]